MSLAEDARSAEAHLLDREATLEEAIASATTLTQRVTDLLDRIHGPAPLSAVRQAMNDVGIHDARTRLETDATDLVEHSLLVLREKQQAEKRARETYEDSLTEATWGLQSCFVTRSNK